jgi:hypothetical protein
MAASKSAKKGQSKADEAGDAKIVVLAEKLGWLLGKAQKQADALPSREALTKQLMRLRDGASDLLDQVSQARAARKKRIAKRKKKANPKASRGPVDAPGKSHRKPPPQEKFERHMGESKVQQMGQKGIKGRMQRGRG